MVDWIGFAGVDWALAVDWITNRVNHTAKKRVDAHFEELYGVRSMRKLEKLDLPEGSKPVKFVFHGGSGSSVEDIQYAIKAGVIKMNIDTDTQWAFWDGIRAYEAKYHDYLQGQIGNPESETKPNKKYYDPRMPLRSGEEAMAARLGEAMEDLNCINVI